ncbi:MAG: helix-turn-helix transcriptional regulator [Nitrospinae bacterium]|nr:helix-turn-helix transcriptional regulator [Nitrospinota bacterium]
MRIDLKIGILRSGLKNYEIAAELGWSPSKLSAVLSESYNPTQAEREAIADVLRLSVYDIFPGKIITPYGNHSPSPEAV